MKQLFIERGNWTVQRWSFQHARFVWQYSSCVFKHLISVLFLQRLSSWTCHFSTYHTLLLFNSDKSLPAAQDIIRGLASVIDNDHTCKFNINRKTVWDSALRGFHRPTFKPQNKMSVKFTDDIGTPEGAVDAGGPRREFLRLLMQCVRLSHVFEGPLDSRNLSLSNSGR